MLAVFTTSQPTFNLTHTYEFFMSFILLIHLLATETNNTRRFVFAISTHFVFEKISKSELVSRKLYLCSRLASKTFLYSFIYKKVAVSSFSISFFLKAHTKSCLFLLATVYETTQNTRLDVKGMKKVKSATW